MVCAASDFGGETARAISRFQVERTKRDFLNNNIMPGFRNMCSVTEIKDEATKLDLMNKVPESLRNGNLSLFMVVEGQHRFVTFVLV